MQTTFQDHDGYKEYLSAVITNKIFHVKKNEPGGSQEIYCSLKIVIVHIPH